EKKNGVINRVSDIAISQIKYTYNGKNRQPSVILKDSQGTVLSSDCYTVNYPKESKTPGTYTLTITLKGDKYEGSTTKNYTIQKANQKVAVYDRLVPGKYITSASKRLDSKTLTLKGAVLQGNKTGKFSFKSDNPSVATVTSWGRITFTGVGTARITATTKGSGNYNPASVTFDLTVLPSPTAITKLQSQKPNWLNIQYRANRKADGYQIQYGTSPDMKGAKYAAVNNSAIRSYTRKDVTSGETYYVRVRTFNVVNGKRYYSNWSGIKSMKVK
ncbi:MAG: Ig-like domain-containing protein, partial [Bacillota bacterium]|nr:Ig-like domain-containing protein [Bacillota bacterium]